MKIKEMQERVWENKLNKGFNTTNIEKEFCLLYGEVSECFEAYLKKKDDLGEELADVAIYLMSISTMLGFDLGSEIENKMAINEKREYKKIDGVNIRIKN